MVEKNSYVHYKYDSNGNMIEKKSYGKDGNLLEKNTYKYDNNDNVIVVGLYESYDLDDIITTTVKYTYAYDKNLNWIKKISFKNDNPLSITERVIVYF